MKPFYKSSSCVYETEFDHYYVEIVEIPESHLYQSWVFDDHYGIKMFMIQMLDDVVYEYFYDYVMSELPDYIQFYKEKYEDEE